MTQASDRKRLFAKNWLSGMNKTEAAIAAGYSEKTAQVKGSQLSRDPAVLEAIAVANAVTPDRHKAALPEGINTDKFAEAVQSLAVSDRVKNVAKPSAPPPAAPGFMVPGTSLAEIEPTDDPKEFLRRVMNNDDVDLKVRLDAAKKLIDFTHKKPGEAGKKEERNDAAKKVAGSFTANMPPKLKAVGV